MGKRKCKLLTISLSPETKKKFDEYCDKEIKNKSRLVEWLLEQYMGQLEAPHLEGLKGGEK